MLFTKTSRQAKNWLREKAHEDSALADLIRFSYKIASHSYSQAFVSILETAVLAVFMENGYYGLFFWVAIIAYVIVTILIAWANEHVRGKIKDTKTFQNALFGIGAVLRSWAISTQKAAKGFKQINVREDTKTAESILSTVDFQTAAFTVCEKLHEFLTKNCDPDDVYVTVFQRYEENKQDLCRMIAYSGSHEPTSYGKTYTIPSRWENLLGKTEYHTYIFASGKKDVTSFYSQESVARVFKPHKGCETRETSIQQYICIPISPAKMGVTFLLQVDTRIPGLFGSTDSAVNEFAKNTIYPFSQFLHMMYEQARVFEQLVK